MFYNSNTKTLQLLVVVSTASILVGYAFVTATTAGPTTVAVSEQKVPKI